MNTATTADNFSGESSVDMLARIRDPVDDQRQQMLASRSTESFDGGGAPIGAGAASSAAAAGAPPTTNATITTTDDPTRQVTGFDYGAAAMGHAEFLQRRRESIAKTAGLFAVSPVPAPSPIAAHTQTTDAEHHRRATIARVKLPPIKIEPPSQPLHDRLPTASPLVHSPTRFSPVQQAMATSDVAGTILTSNECLCELFNVPIAAITGRSIFDFIDAEYRYTLMHECRRVFESQASEMVVRCGCLVRALKHDAERSRFTASLWLKYRLADGGTRPIFQWIFERVNDTSVDVLFSTRSNKILYVHPWDAFEELFDVRRSDQSVEIQHLLPTIHEALPTIMQSSQRKNIMTARSRTSPLNGGNLRFPVMVQHLKDAGDKLQVRVTSMAHIAGLVIVRGEDDSIKQANESFVEYLFGRTADELTQQRAKVTELLPFWSELKERACVAIQPTMNMEGLRSPMLNAKWVRQAMTNSGVVEKPLNGSASTSYFPNDHHHQSELVAIHRDGGRVPIDVQIRQFQDAQSPQECGKSLFAVWIRFDRSMALTHKRPPSPGYGGSAIQKQASLKDGLTTALAAATGEPTTHLGMEVQRRLEDYELVQKLGEGGFGFVYMVKSRTDPRQPPSVIKYIVKGKVMPCAWANDPHLGRVTIELQILDYLRRHPHPNIVRMTHLFQNADYFFVEMALHGEGMDLFDYNEFNRNISEREIRLIFQQLCSAIQFLHSHGIVHRDTKEENVIIDRQARVQLIDFGSASWLKPGEPFTTFAGTVDYIAPEVLLGKPHDGRPQDVWALGILLYTLIYKESPFFNIDEIIGRPVRVPFILSPESFALLRGMLTRNPNKRFTMDQVLGSEWFTGDGK